jgi:hypothetical protein
MPKKMQRQENEGGATRGRGSAEVLRMASTAALRGGIAAGEHADGDQLVGRATRGRKVPTSAIGTPRALASDDRADQRTADPSLAGAFMPQRRGALTWLGLRRPARRRLRSHRNCAPLCPARCPIGDTPQGGGSTATMK